MVLIKGYIDGMKEIDRFELRDGIILGEIDIVVGIVDVEGRYDEKELVLGKKLSVGWKDGSLLELELRLIVAI